MAIFVSVKNEFITKVVGKTPSWHINQFDSFGQQYIIVLSHLYVCPLFQHQGFWSSYRSDVLSMSISITCVAKYCHDVGLIDIRISINVQFQIIPQTIMSLICTSLSVLKIIYWIKDASKCFVFWGYRSVDLISFSWTSSNGEDERKMIYQFATNAWLNKLLVAI